MVNFLRVFKKKKKKMKRMSFLTQFKIRKVIVKMPARITDRISFSCHLGI